MNKSELKKLVDLLVDVCSIYVDSGPMNKNELVRAVVFQLYSQSEMGFLTTKSAAVDDVEKIIRRRVYHGFISCKSPSACAISMVDAWETYAGKFEE